MNQGPRIKFILFLVLTIGFSGIANFGFADIVPDEVNNKLCAFHDANGGTVALLDHDGNLFLKDALTTSVSSLGDTSDKEWLVQNGSTVRARLKLSGTPGKLEIAGTLSEYDQNSLASHPYLFMYNSMAKASIDTNNGLHLRGWLAPAMPANLNTTSRAPNNVQLTWANPGRAVAGYEVYRDGTWLQTVMTTGCTDSTAQFNTTYQYKVRAYKNVGSPPTKIYSLFTAPITVIPKPTVTVSVDRATVNEGDSLANRTVAVTFSISPTVSSPVDVPFSFGGTTTAAYGTEFDYTSDETSQRTIPATQSSISFNVTVRDDSAAEFDETIQLIMTEPSNAYILANPQDRASITIQDNDTMAVADTTSGLTPETDESSAVGWDALKYGTGTSPYSWDNESTNDTASRTGYGALKISGVTGNEIGWRRLIDINTNKNYYCDVWVKTNEKVTTAGLKAIWYNSSKIKIGNTVVNNKTLTGENDWTLMALALDTPTGAEYVEIQLYGNQSDSSAVVWFDDLRIVPNLLDDGSFESSQEWMTGVNIPVSQSANFSFNTSDKYQDDKCAMIADLYDTSATRTIDAYWTKANGGTTESISFTGSSSNFFTFEVWSRVHAETNEIGNPYIQFDESYGGLRKIPRYVFGRYQTWNVWKRISISREKGKGNNEDVVIRLGYSKNGLSKAGETVRFDTARLTDGDNTLNRFEVVTASDRATSGCPLVVTVRALNKYGDSIPNYDGTITLTTSLQIDRSFETKLNNTQSSYAFMPSLAEETEGEIYLPVYNGPIESNDRGETAFDIVTTQTGTLRIFVAKSDGSTTATSRAVNVMDYDSSLPFLECDGGNIEKKDTEEVVKLTGFNAAHQLMACQDNLRKADFRNLKEMGVNCIRLNIQWDSFIPRLYYTTTTLLNETPLVNDVNGDGKDDVENYNRAAFAWFDNVIDWCEANGIYVIIDFERLHTGVKTNNEGTAITGSVFYRMPIFNNDSTLYNSSTPEGELRKRILASYRHDFVNAWRVLTKRYGKRGSVIFGYDLCGEPSRMKRPLTSESDSHDISGWDVQGLTGRNLWIDVGERVIHNTALSTAGFNQKNIDRNHVYIMESGHTAGVPELFVVPGNVGSISNRYMHSSHWYSGPFEEGDERAYNTSGAKLDIYNDCLDAAADYPLWFGEYTAPMIYQGNHCYRFSREHPFYLGYAYELLNMFERQGWSHTFWNLEQVRHESPGNGVATVSTLYNSEYDGNKTYGSGLAAILTDVNEVNDDDDIPTTMTVYAFDKLDQYQLLSERMAESYMCKVTSDTFNSVTDKGELPTVSSGYHNFPYTYTDQNNGIYEVLKEKGVGEQQPELIHYWELNIPNIVSSDRLELYIKAHRTHNKFTSQDVPDKYKIKYGSSKSAAEDSSEIAMYVETGPNLSIYPEVATYNERYMVAKLDTSRLVGNRVVVRVSRYSSSGFTTTTPDTLYVDHMYILRHQFVDEYVTVRMPEFGEQWGVSTTQQVNWLTLYTGGSHSYAVELHPVSGGNVISLGTFNTETGITNILKDVNIGASITPGSYTVHVINQSDTDIQDQSNWPVEIKKLHVLSRGGDEWPMNPNQTRQVSWSSTRGGSRTDYDVLLINNLTGASTILNQTGGDSSNPFTAFFSTPTSLSEGLYKLRVQHKTYTDEQDDADRFIYVKEVGVIGFSDPNGNETWTRSSSYNVNWTAGKTGDYDMYLMSMKTPFENGSSSEFTTHSLVSSPINIGSQSVGTTQTTTVTVPTSVPLDKGLIMGQRPYVIRVEKRNSNRGIGDESDKPVFIN